ncbi:MAG: carbon-nitrogen family hydrolase [Clostridiales bacterium]|nr:carbon-nitrogen family hydrolase [Clostridiales bacterium]
MKIKLIQMDMKLGEPEYNYRHGEILVCRAAEEGADVICLPETWNVGFFPKENLKELADRDGKKTYHLLETLASKYSVNLVGGSAALYHSRENRVTNTGMIFHRSGEMAASYDKVHLFSNMGEDRYFHPGNQIKTFSLDGIKCGMVICYDIRFPEWIRKTVLEGIQLLFVSAQWPESRLNHWRILNQARAIENQVFVAAVNSCGRGEGVRYAGHSMIVDPVGNILAEGGDKEEILTADLDFSQLGAIRREIPVFDDRRERLYLESIPKRERRVTSAQQRFL